MQSGNRPPVPETPLDYKALKNAGFLRQKQGDKFSLRLRVVGGNVGADALAVIAAAAKKYGRGYVHLTSRQSVEIPFVDVNDIEAIQAELRAGGVETGVCGAAVRTVTACQGNAICSSGRIETTGLARELADRYLGRALPHKFKIGITGCPNNCLKAEENDIGIKGGYAPGGWERESCNLCGLCLKACRTRALSLSGERLVRDEASCTACGRCAVSCHGKAWGGRPVYLLSFGGLFGNRIATGERAAPAVHDKETLFRMTDAALDFYDAHGRPGERFRYAIERAGWDAFSRAMGEAAAR